MMANILVTFIFTGRIMSYSPKVKKNRRQKETFYATMVCPRKRQEVLLSSLLARLWRELSVNHMISN
jgi:hypothetical protein